MPTPCPYCGRQPHIERCEPWPKEAGPQPWYAGCYSGGEREHFIGTNGDTRADALKNWEQEVNRHDPQPGQTARYLQADRETGIS